jgi:ParB-like chromosome segregation protein Spo0J
MKVSTLRVEDLSHYHKNARLGNVSRIVSSLRANGQYKPIVVNLGTHTGRPNEVAAGNHVLKAAKQLGWEKIAAHVVDLEEPALIRLVLADNKTSDDSTYDMAALDDLLGELAEYEVEDLEGSGYTLEDVDDVALEAAEELERREQEAERGTSISDVLKGQNAVVSFTIVFDDADQRAVWDRWVRRLRAEAAVGRTVGALITEALEGILEETE